MNLIKNTKEKSGQILDKIFCSLVGNKVSSPQLFIVGLPRCGATLVYQYIIHRLHVAYFTNGAGNRHYIPCITTTIQKLFRKPYISDFKSNYGRVSGPMAPREAGKIWGLFFEGDKYQTFEDIPEQNRKNLYNLITCIQKIFGDVPFVNKNVRNSLHIDALSKIFPESRFLIVERNIEDVALSILRGRKLIHGDYKIWFSVKPRNYNQIKDLPIVEQIYHQIKDITECIKESIQKIDLYRVKLLKYEDFCKNPEIVIKQFSDIFQKTKIKNPPVTHFVIKKQHPNTNLEKELIDIVKYLK